MTDQPDLGEAMRRVRKMRTITDEGRHYDATYFKDQSFDLKARKASALLYILPEEHVERAVDLHDQCKAGFDYTDNMADLVDLIDTFGCWKPNYVDMKYEVLRLPPDTILDVRPVNVPNGHPHSKYFEVYLLQGKWPKHDDLIAICNNQHPDSHPKNLGGSVGKPERDLDSAQPLDAVYRRIEIYQD